MPWSLDLLEARRAELAQPWATPRVIAPCKDGACKGGPRAQDAPRSGKGRVDNAIDPSLTSDGPPLQGLRSTNTADLTPDWRSCEKIAALPPDLRKGSAFPYLGLNTKAFRLGRLPESRKAFRTSNGPAAAAWEQ